MKSSPEVLAHIERLYDWYLESPRHYAPDPQAFEQKLWTLEEIREFILDVGSRGIDSAESGYTKFLRERGFGAGDFTSSKSTDGSIANVADVFSEMASFWREFLHSPCRSQPA